MARTFEFVLHFVGCVTVTVSLNQIIIIIIIFFNTPGPARGDIKNDKISVKKQIKNLDLVALVLRLCGHCANYACSVALLKRHRQPLKQKSGFAPVTSHCGNAVTEFMQKLNSLRAPVTRDLTCQRNENVVTSQLLVFLVFKDAALSAAEPASSDVKGR